MAELIDMSQVPVPDVIKPLDFESRFSDLKAQLVALYPESESVLELESEPLTKFLQLLAYRELHLVGQINDDTRGNMLASSVANDLEAIAARFNLTRLTITSADDTAEPPIAAVMESDDALRRRVQMAFDGLNTAGSIDGYIFFALSSNGLVADASAVSPEPCEMVLTILSHEANGVASNQLLGLVRQYFGVTADGLNTTATPSKVRPDGDHLTVQVAEVLNYQVNATLQIKAGPDAPSVLATAQQAISTYTQQRKLGRSKTLSGIYAALHQPGVSNVKLSSPVANINCSAAQFAYCTAINVSLEVIND